LLNFIRNVRINTQDLVKPSWWTSHFMAPAAIDLGDVVRIFLGCHDEYGISRIGFIEISKDSPNQILRISEDPVLDIGEPGSFDENGVFPGSMFKFQDKLYFSYTGFQLGMKIPHYNFGNIAIFNKDLTKLTRLQKSPLLDRSDEGLTVRAGITVQENGKNNIMLYSSGSTFEKINNKLRPNYSIFRQNILEIEPFPKIGFEVLSFNKNLEHGLGRPYLIRFKDEIYCFYTIRNKDFLYRSGVAVYSEESDQFERKDSLISSMGSNSAGFDDQMVYFPAPCLVGEQLWVFYSGNDFGKSGLGIGIFQ